MILSTKLITKALIRLCGCPGCLRLIGPQTSEDRFSHVKAHMKIILPIWKGLSDKQTMKALIRLLLWSSLIWVCTICQVISVGMRELLPYISSGLQIKVHNWCLFLKQNICCGDSKESFQWDGSFEHPKHVWINGYENNFNFTLKMALPAPRKVSALNSCYWVLCGLVT